MFSLLYAKRPSAAKANVTVPIEHEHDSGEVESFDIEATGYFSLGSCASEESQYYLDTWEHDDLSHLPEDLQAKIRAGNYNHLFTSKLEEAELL